MKANLGLIFILFFFVSCNEQKNTKNHIDDSVQKSNIIEDSNSVKKPIVTGEDFQNFMYEFTADSVFQISRIKFPLEKEVFKDNDYDETEIQMINEKEWEHLILFQNMEYNIQLYDNFECKLRDSDERVFAYEGNENGISVKYYFKRINSKWYLIKITDLST